MKWTLLSLPLLFVTLISSTAVADHIYLIPNDGSGDNFGFVGHMNGHPFFLNGGTAFREFGTGGYVPGMTFPNDDGTLYLYSSVIWFNGAPTEFFFPMATSMIFMSSITLPTKGRDFTVPWEVGFSALGVNDFGDQNLQILVTGQAMGKLSFFYSPETKLYYPGAFEQAPEPGMLGLMITGIAGIVASARNRLRRPRA